MAVFDKKSKLISILDKGMTPNESSKGISWIQNMGIQESSWTTRAGFGTVAVLDSCMTTGREAVDGFPIGLQRHLGSYLIRDTGFGHRQIVSIFRTNTYTSDFLKTEEVYGSLWQRLNQYRTIYTAFVYDLTTDERFEVPLSLHTSQMDDDIADRHAVYETVRGVKHEMNYQQWVDAGQNEQGPNREFNTDKDEYFWFVEAKDSATRVLLTFGNARAGAWVYTPIDPRFSEKDYRQRRMSVEGTYTQDYKEAYGEVSCIAPIGIRDGIFAPDGITYLTQDEFGKPQAACLLDRRMVYAVDNVLYFSDPEDLNAITDGNVQGFPSKIVAIAPTLGNLLVWTEDKRTFYYNPAKGDLISGGRTTEISDNIGILGPNAWTNVDGAVIWVDESGIYRNYGNTSVQRISDPIQVFFEGIVSNSLLNYYTASGYTVGTSPQPRTFYEWNPTAWVGINVDYEPTHSQILITIPNLLLSFVLEKDGFHVWNYESVVSEVFDAASGTYVPVVKGVRNMPKPWLLADVADIYMVTDVRTQAITDATNLGPAPTGYNTPENSFAIMRLGRGGGLDASINTKYEDRRQFTGEWNNTGLNEDLILPLRDRATFFINKPLKIPVGYNFSWGGQVVADSDLSPMWIPIELVPNWNDIAVAPDAATNVTSWHLEFQFDNRNWAPYINLNAINNYEAIWDLPPERLGAVGAYFLQNADDAANQGVWVFNSTTGLPDAFGNTIKMTILGAAATHVTAPEFNFIPRFRNPVIMLAFKKLAVSSNDTFSPGIRPTVATHSTGRYADRPVQVLVWDDQTRAIQLSQDDYQSVQSVDWIYTSKEQNSEEGGFMMKARGLNLDIKSSGNATLLAQDPGVAAWPLRLFNTVTSTNYKQYAAQLLDFATTPNAVIKTSKNAIRNRLGTTAAQTTATYANPSVQGPTWGDFNNSAAGNLLIGDGEYDNIKTSVGVKGDRLVTQMFGHILSAAEKVRIGSASLLVRLIPGFRRRGR